MWRAAHIFARVRTGCYRDPVGGPCHKERALGHFLTDPIGFCDELRPFNSTTSLSATKLLASPLVPDPRSRLYLGQYVARFATVAQQCPFAKLSTPIVCCGRWNHICGIRQCPFHPDNTQQNQRFARRAWQTAELRRNASAPFVRLVRCAQGNKPGPRQARDCPQWGR